MSREARPPTPTVYSPFPILFPFMPLQKAVWNILINTNVASSWQFWNSCLSQVKSPRFTWVQSSRKTSNCHSICPQWWLAPTPAAVTRMPSAVTKENRAACTSNKMHSRLGPLKMGKVNQRDQNRLHRVRLRVGRLNLAKLTVSCAVTTQA